MGAAPTQDFQFDRQMMRRSIELAMRRRREVEPNPMVGCVIVKNARIIGEGWHQRFGGAHAEPNALASCSESPEGATAYVTLEPCSRLQKKTPPCVPALIAARLAHVVVGCIDPHPHQMGLGVERLRQAGMRVETGVSEIQARQLIAPFIACIQHARPYVTLKWAQSADRKVAGAGGRPAQISNPRSMEVAHGLRARSDAILVGINTVLSDDPMLTARGVPAKRRLIRCVVDGQLRIPRTSKLVASARQNPLLVFCQRQQAQGEAAGSLRERGVEVFGVGDERPISLIDVLLELGRRAITHVLVEPGPTLARSFIKNNLADRLWVLRSPMAISDPTAPSAIEVPYPATAAITLSDDVLTEYLNPNSPVFFANAPSADLLLAMPPGGASP